ncbi:amidohydrolase family protein [Halorubrum vacuolatum]|uniref:Amidohydrolase-related domain-containing protein n=1 Tax=Halorubrum vacuolatum TaxID=63740 RepID=A0A238XAC0_HALVU|nr:amidohydrolase family protein [Halorubrum vacuolatum]SNR55986.1 hypothetical protein SAMN06264855_11553 [Halorubrum vacuolatum]
MYQHQGEDVFVIDGHIHMWDASEENIKHRGGEQFIQCFYDYHTAFTPEERQRGMDDYRKFTPEDVKRDLFTNYVDMGVYQPTHLHEFYTEGFNTVDDLGETLYQEYPDRFVLNGRWDPRDGEAGLKELERQKEEYDIKGAKVYTAEWKGDSKGWRLDSDEAFEFLQKCADLGVKNIHPHKGPTIRPLNKDAFDVADVDLAASSFPELNFIVEHVGLPRLDDFCWIATQEPNVYGGIAVAAPMALSRPKKFSEIMCELLYWLGEDQLTFGSDYGIWDPDWVIEAVMETELSADQHAEYGVEFGLEAKKKLMGENIAELYDIDIEERKKAFRTDAISEEFGLGDSYDTAAPADD